jgi:hypothetical protein
MAEGMLLRSQMKFMHCADLYLPDTFPTWESAIEAAIKAGRQKIDVGFERGRAVVNE